MVTYLYELMQTLFFYGNLPLSSGSKFMFMVTYLYQLAQNLLFFMVIYPW